MEAAVFEGHRIVAVRGRKPLDVRIDITDGQTLGLRLRYQDTVVLKGGVESAWSWTTFADCIVLTVPTGTLSASAPRITKISSDLLSAASAHLDAVMLTDTVSELSPLLAIWLRHLRAAISHVSRSSSNPSLQRLMSSRYRDLAPLMRENFLRTIGVSELASELQVSSSRFNRDFKQALGTTPACFLRQMRMDEAQLLLKDNSLSISEVAHACGYADQSHMHRSFKSAIGITPGEMRDVMFNADD